MERCATCRWWGWPGEDADDEYDERSCARISDWPGIYKPDPYTAEEREGTLAYVQPWAGSDGGGLATSPDFGCVNWEHA